MSRSLSKQPFTAGSDNSTEKLSKRLFPFLRRFLLCIFICANGSKLRSAMKANAAVVQRTYQFISPVSSLQTNSTLVWFGENNVDQPV